MDILHAQPASGTDLAERLRFGFGASGSTAVEVQLQHFCKKTFTSEVKPALHHKPKIDRLSPPNFKTYLDVLCRICSMIAFLSLVTSEVAS